MTPPNIHPHFFKNHPQKSCHLYFFSHIIYRPFSCIGLDFLQPLYIQYDYGKKNFKFLKLLRHSKNLNYFKKLSGLTPLVCHFASASLNSLNPKL